MEKVIVSVGITENNYSAHIEIGDGVVAATGNSFDELKAEMQSAVEFHIEGMQEDGEEIPAPFDGRFELVYRFDPESLLTHYRGILSFSALERMTGINQRQLYRYASGRTKPQEEQRQKISGALHGLGKELMGVEL